MTESILELALPTPLRRTFDYLPPEGVDLLRLQAGQRLLVPFGRSRRVGLLLAVKDASAVPAERLRRAERLLDEEPLVAAGELEFLQWVADYYHHPVGEVLFHALPAPLRRGKPARPPALDHWRLQRHPAPEELKRAPRQAALAALLSAHPAGLAAEHLDHAFPGWRPLMRQLARRGLAVAGPAPPNPCSTPALELNDEQRRVLDTLEAHLDGFHPCLLEGVTGSGKTEVYLRLAEAVLARGRQVLVLVPEIGLTPQLLQRFARLPTRVVALHSGMSDGERLAAWWAARRGEAGVIIGTRSAVFAPLARPGLVVVDEEHDPSFKQHEGLRYSGRDLALVRARRWEVPVILGSATPSLESLHHAREGRYLHLRLSRRAGGARPPQIECLDLRGQPLHGNLSPVLLEHMTRHLDRGEQVLLYLNRRGYSPVLLCHECGWVAQCPRCDSRYTLHKGRGELRCHHCDKTVAVPRQCPACGSVDLRPLGFGTERTEEVLRQRFPQMPVLRIDRDSTRRKGSLEAVLERARAGGAAILLGTQMLAKGHHLPQITLAAILDADQGLHGNDFRALERLAQLITQVSGRAGRGECPGRVLIQTHHPDHPLLTTLVQAGYPAFAEAALAERRAAGLPPFAHLALIRAESPSPEAPERFLRAALARRPESPVTCLGPAPAAMERRAGRHRFQILLISPRRAPLHRLIAAWIPALEALPEARRVRWSLDIDPQETF